jgi:hypothetical protein
MDEPFEILQLAFLYLETPYRDGNQLVSWRRRMQRLNAGGQIVQVCVYMLYYK